MLGRGFKSEEVFSLNLFVETFECVYKCYCINLISYLLYSSTDMEGRDNEHIYSKIMFLCF